MLKNMKIAINDQQPLDEVVRELERLGYRQHIWEPHIKTEYVVGFGSGVYTNADFNPINKIYDLTILTKLKEME